MKKFLLLVVLFSCLTLLKASDNTENREIILNNYYNNAQGLRTFEVSSIQGNKYTLEKYVKDTPYFIRCYIDPYINSEIYPTDSNQINASFKDIAPFIASTGMIGWIFSSPIESFPSLYKQNVQDCLSYYGGYAALSSILISQFTSATFIQLLSNKIPRRKKILIGSFKALTIAATIISIKKLNNSCIPPIVAALGTAYANWFLDYPNRALLRPYFNKH